MKENLWNIFNTDISDGKHIRVLVWFMVFNATFKKYFSYIVAVTSEACDVQRYDDMSEKYEIEEINGSHCVNTVINSSHSWTLVDNC